MATNDQIRGAIYGMAFGDSWGFLTEFNKHDDILFVEPKPPSLLQITDDTQMSIYNAVTLQEIFECEEDDLSELAVDANKQNRVRKLFADSHLKFEEDEDNNRAPGVTVMSSLWVYRRSAQKTGLEGSCENDSKGCGTVMRAPWIGLVPWDRETIALLAILQSETTHGHAQASLSSAIAALLMSDIVSGKFELPRGNAVSRVMDMFTVVSDLAAEVMQIKSNLVASEDFQNAVLELRDLIYKILKVVVNLTDSDLLDPNADLCQWFGQGWIAEEALLCAVAAFALYGNDVYGGIRRLVYSNGDSDSIAAIGGSFLGAYTGGQELFDQAKLRAVRILGRFEPRYNMELSLAEAFFSELN